MQNEFNEQEYRRKLIEGGLSEADATDLAACTAAARRTGSAGGAFRPAGSLFELPATAGDNEAALPPKLPTPASRRAIRSAWRRNRPSLRARWPAAPEPRNRQEQDGRADRRAGPGQTEKVRWRPRSERPAVSWRRRSARPSRRPALAIMKQQISDMQLAV